MKEILVLYYSDHGNTKKLAYLIARGIESIEGVRARIRTVPKIIAVDNSLIVSQDNREDIYATLNDLHECVGLALGSPAYFGNMASSLKYFFDSTTHEWLSGTLTGKPACVFTSSGSMHGGQEACLLTMLLPLIHHGMILVGIPSTSKLMNTKTGGTPYGASHLAGTNSDYAFSEEEKTIAIEQGQRLAQVALKLFK